MAVPETARYVRNVAQKETLLVDTSPILPVKDQIVLPEARGRGANADDAVFLQKFPQEITLKVVGFLKRDEIRLIFPEKKRIGFLALKPAVRPVIRQPETKIEGHKGKHVVFLPLVWKFSYPHFVCFEIRRGVPKLVRPHKKIWIFQARMIST